MKRRPRLSERLLGAVVADEASFLGLLGDLHEEAARRGGRTAGPSYDYAVLSLALSYIADRIGRRRADGSARGPKGGGSGPAAELRMAYRLLRRRPGYAIATAGTLALGFGAAIAVLSVAYGVWLKPLPFGEPAGIVRVYEVKLPEDQGGGMASAEATAEAELGRRSRVSPPLLRDLRDTEFSTLTDVASVSGAAADWRREGQAQRIDLVTASRGVFDILQLRPIAGRFFSADPGTAEVVLSEGLWRSAFGSDPAVIGRDSMDLDGLAHLIVGVVRDDLPYPELPAAAWIPSDPGDEELAEGMRGARYLDVIGRLQPGATTQASAQEIDMFVRGLAAAHSQHEGWGATAVPLRQDMIRPFAGILRVLLTGAALFLGIAGSNAAALMAARRARDDAERRLRSALGASRWQLVRHELAQMAWISVAANLAAITLAMWALSPLRRWAPADMPRIAEIGLEPAIVVILSVLLFVAATLAALGGDLVSSGSGRPGNTGAGRTVAPGSRGRAVLTVVQVALTTVLLIGGAALARHFAELARIQPGFAPDGVVSTSVAINETAYPEPAARQQFFDTVTTMLRERGHAAATGTNLPVSGANMRFGYRGGDRSTEQHWGQYHAVSPGYFDVLNVPIVAGRAFQDGDRADGLPVVIVNEALAALHFDGDPVGRRMIVVGTEREIVGVAGSVRHFGPDQAAPPELYVPFAQDPWAFGSLIVRPGAGFSPADVREIVAAIDPTIPVSAAAPYEDFLHAWFAPLRFQLGIVGLLAAAGTLLAVIGLYALIAYVVAGRTREIGIRVALGESGRSVFARIVGRGLALAAAGVVAGIGCGLALANLVRSLGVEIVADDPNVLVGVAAAVALASIAACAIPARRAAAVDPVITLRQN